MPILTLGSAHKFKCFSYALVDKNSKLIEACTGPDYSDVLNNLVTYIDNNYTIIPTIINSPHFANIYAQYGIILKVCNDEIDNFLEFCGGSSKDCKYDYPSGMIECNLILPMYKNYIPEQHALIKVTSIDTIYEIYKEEIRTGFKRCFTLEFMRKLIFENKKPIQLKYIKQMKLYPSYLNVQTQ